LSFAAELAQVGFGIADTIPMPMVKLGSTMPVAQGMIISQEQRDPFLSSTARLTADAPFQVLSDGVYMYVFRQSISDAGDPNAVLVAGPNGEPIPLVPATLLVDRFVLVGAQLEPVREVRFQRSRSKTHPQSGKDSLGAADLDHNPFYEPTQ